MTGLIALAHPHLAGTLLNPPPLARSSQLGFAAALGAELSTGEPVLTQLGDAPAAIAATFVAFTVASLIPMLKGANPEEALGPFTPAVEKTNGRFAMIGGCASPSACCVGAAGHQQRGKRGSGKSNLQTSPDPRLAALCSRLDEPPPLLCPCSAIAHRAPPNPFPPPPSRRVCLAARVRGPAGHRPVLSVSSRCWWAVLCTKLMNAVVHLSWKMGRCC